MRTHAAAKGRTGRRMLLPRPAQLSRLLSRPVHTSTDRIAVFGGNPPKHREQANRRLAPFESLVLFGSPRDTGSGDTKRLVNAIRNGKLDVVYNWSKFGNHASRKMIQVACQKAPGDVVFKDVSTLDMLQWQRQD